MFNRILVTMDNADTMSQSTFEKAVTLAKQHHARLMLLQVLPTDASSEPHLSDLQSFHKTAKSQGLVSDVAQLQGDHDRVVCNLANRWGADLIVLGQHDTHPDPQPEPSLPARFAQQAPCSVLVAQKPDSLHLKASQVEQFAMI